MRNQTIILIGYDIAISHSIYIESLSSHRGIEIIKANEKQFKEEPLVFPIRNYDLNFLDNY